MKFVKPVCIAALAVAITGAVALRAEAAPLPTNVTAIKAALGAPIVQVRYGRWGGGWGGGYRGWGNRGWGYRGYRGWGLGAAAAGAVVGGAIASSAYYGGGYPYSGESYAYDGGYGYGGGYAYGGGGYASEYCPPSGYGGYYPRYRARYYSGW